MNALLPALVVALLGGCISAPATTIPDDRSIRQVIEDAGMKAEDFRTESPEPDRCPPLPSLRVDATRYEEKLFLQTLIALYAQCAGSKK